MTKLIFLKLGGSVITDKDHSNTPDTLIIEAIARSIRQALDYDPDLTLVVGHGSGSFGHHAAKKYNTRNGVVSHAEWTGFTQVALRARELNQIVMDRLINAGIEAISISPFSMIKTDNHKIVSWDTSTLIDCLNHKLIPIIYGDVILDHTLGGTILSTEELFEYLSLQLHPEKILLAGLEKGIWKDYPQNTQLINEISPTDWNNIQSDIKGSDSPDVTGGMFSKVQTMISIINHLPTLEVQIFSGQAPENILSVLSGEQKGTIIRNPKG